LPGVLDFASTHNRNQETPTVLAVAILAIVQGLTEFLPVSSSGHLVLFGHVLRSERQGLVLDLVLHGGSLLVLLVHYRRDLFSLASRTFSSHPEAPELRRLLLSLIVATGITGTLGLLFQSELKAQFERPIVAALCLVVTAAGLFSTRLIRHEGTRSFGILVGVAVGLAQSLAMLPGISRAGATIVAGLWMGLKPEAAGRFAFLLAIPAIGGALLLELKDIGEAAAVGGASSLIVGFLVSVLASWVGLKLVLRFVERGRIAVFGVYCLLVGIVAAALISAGY
jgi:undecaprenyl-diphosphatase